MRLAMSATGILGLQRLAGNAAVGRALRRTAPQDRPSRSRDGDLESVGDPEPAAVQRDDPPAKGDVHERIRLAIQHHDYLSIPPDDELAAATDDERIALSQLCIAGGFYAPQQASQRVLMLWTAMGDRLPAMVTAHLKEWDAAVGFSPRLKLIPPVVAAQAAFNAALRSTALANLNENKKFVQERTQRLGLDGSQPLTPAQQDEVRQAIQSTAHHAYELRTEQSKLRGLVVGWETHNLGFGEHESKFDPGRPPPVRGTLFDTPPADWDQCKETWDDAEHELSTIGNDYPELYSAAAADETGAALLDLSRVTSAGFGERTKQHLLTLLERIREVEELITSGKLDLLDLGVLTQGVLNQALPYGPPAPGARDWTVGLDQWAAKRVLADHKADQDAVRMLLKTVEVTAMVVGTFAGGIGAVVAAGATAGLEAFQAGQAAVDAQRLEQAATATPKTGTALVAKAQADSRRSEAIAHAVQAVVAALLAGHGLIKGGLRAIRLKGMVSDEAMLARLRAAVNDDAALEKLIRTFEDPGALDRLLQTTSYAKLQPLLQRIGPGTVARSLLRRCPDTEMLSRFLDRVEAQQLDDLLAGVAEADLPRLERILKSLGDAPPSSISFSIGGELETEAGQVIINPGRAAMPIPKLRALRPDNFVVEAGAERIPFPDNCGRLIQGNKLPNSIDWDTAAQEFRRVLGPGGRVEITVYGSGAKLRAALTRNGFEVTPPLQLPGGQAIDNSVFAVRR